MLQKNGKYVMKLWDYSQMAKISNVHVCALLHGLQFARIFCPLAFPGKNTGVGCHFLLQGIFPTQGSNPCLLHCRQTLYHLSHQGSPVSLKTTLKLGFLSSAAKFVPLLLIHTPSHHQIRYILQQLSLSSCRILTSRRQKHVQVLPALPLKLGLLSYIGMQTRNLFLLKVRCSLRFLCTVSLRTCFHLFTRALNI